MIEVSATTVGSHSDLGGQTPYKRLKQKTTAQAYSVIISCTHTEDDVDAGPQCAASGVTDACTRRKQCVAFSSS